MTKNAKAATLLAQDSGMTDDLKQCFAGIIICPPHSTTSSVDGQAFSAYLRNGEANALPADVLSDVMGCSERALRKIVERERACGALIISSERGYFLPSVDPQQAELEVSAFVRRLDRRMISNRLCVRSAKRWLKNRKSSGIKGQLEIGEVVDNGR